MASERFVKGHFEIKGVISEQAAIKTADYLRLLYGDNSFSVRKGKSLGYEYSSDTRDLVNTPLFKKISNHLLEVATEEVAYHTEISQAKDSEDAVHRIALHRFKDKKFNVSQANALRDLMSQHTQDQVSARAASYRQALAKSLESVEQYRQEVSHPEVMKSIDAFTQGLQKQMVQLDKK